MRAEDREYLRRAARAFDVLVERARAAREAPEQALRWARLAADFATRHHPGRYADARLENLLLEVGRALPAVAPLEPDPERRHVLHLLSECPPSGAGGHVRILRNWMERDRDSRHSVLVTRQWAADLPEWLAARLLQAWGPERTRVERVQGVRAAVAGSQAHLVVLHHHPDDPIPVAAFAFDGGPPVALLDHADHLFQLGATVADATLHIRGFAEELARRRRFARTTALLPVPIHPPRPERAEPLAGTPIVTIGQQYKYTPTESHDFFRAALRVLERNPDAHLYLIGVESAPDHPRLHPLGVVADPAPYLAAAQLYLEGFPYGGLTALLEAAALGVPPVLMHAPTPQLRIADVAGLAGHVENPADEDAWCAEVEALLRDPARRRALGASVREQVRREHAREWPRYLTAVYELPLEHRAVELPETPVEETDDDLNLARFNRATDRGRPLLASVGRGQLTRAEIWHLWRASRRLGDRRLGVWLRRLRKG